MRFVAATLCWLLATAALAAALPVTWLQCNVIDPSGYARLAQRAAADPTLQQAVAAELSVQAVRLIAAHGYTVDPAEVRDAASDYTAGRAFPAQFVRLNRDAHDWLFKRGRTGPWVIDVEPMLRDTAFASLLTDRGVEMPKTLPIRMAPPGADEDQSGALQPLTRWGPVLALGLAALAGVCAVLTVGVARHRGRALAALGVAALLVGAAGWAGLETGRRYLSRALAETTADVRRIADVLADLAEDSLHGWFNGALAGGAALVVVGALVAMLGAVTRRSSRVTGRAAAFRSR
ncbi:Nif11-like leader peptide family natural product precursor [Mycobacterium sp. M1]|uniref:Nif11-like leader peptide family natural product n=1 Tax=Mycolicibacter acidiphilus TaxID=2835306 RepID=A0ABS5REY8_9MYCO|nr:Nif11-like leader peptide family natural product precursor [Mycolicibacter acidiphilus]MBS9532833.1 Nif11-like leader peptide family natural product precursor [Mycolicibacter acidiphilus]